MRKVALGIIALLIIALVSGCISQTQTVTVTETKYVPTTENHTEKKPKATPSSSLQTKLTTTPSTATSTPTKEEGLIKADCTGNAWRDDYEQAIVCGVQAGFDNLLLPEDLGIHATDKLKVPLEFAQYVGNNIHLDIQKENKSMIMGKYFDIKTPLELVMEKNGTYADIAILGAYVFLQRGLNTYVVYIKTEKGFGLLPGFRVQEKYYDRIFVIFWPYVIPMTLGGAVDLLKVAGDPVKEIKLYKLWLDNRKVRAKLEETIEPGPIIPRYLTSPSWDFYDNQVEIILDFKKKFPKAVQEKNPNCRYVESTNEIYYRRLKEYEVEIPLLMVFYSKTYHNRYMDLLTKTVLQHLEQKGFDPQSCAKFTILEIIPSALAKEGVHVRIWVETR